MNHAKNQALVGRLSFPEVCGRIIAELQGPLHATSGAICCAFQVMLTCGCKVSGLAGVGAGDQKQDASQGEVGWADHGEGLALTLCQASVLSRIWCVLLQATTP